LFHHVLPYEKKLKMLCYLCPAGKQSLFYEGITHLVYFISFPFRLLAENWMFKELFEQGGVAQCIIYVIECYE